MTDVSKLVEQLSSDAAWEQFIQMFKDSGCYCPPPYCTHSC